MPDVNGNGRAPQPPALPAVEVVKQPMTDQERRKQRLEQALAETDDERSTRRASELKRHGEAHAEWIAEAHAMHPAPVHRDWEAMTEAEQKAWNARRELIDSANKAYHLAVRRVYADHVAEDMHIRREMAKRENA